MKVSELILKLSELPQDRPVYIGSDIGISQPTIVRKETLPADSYGIQKELPYVFIA